MNSTNSTLAGELISHIVFWEDVFGLDSYIFSFCNGTWDGSNCIGGSGDWLDGWDYRINITIDNSKVDETLNNFPVYINLSELNSDFHTNVKSDGGDIRITENDGVTEVPREIVFYDSGKDTEE